MTDEIDVVRVYGTQPKNCAECGNTINPEDDHWQVEKRFWCDACGNRIGNDVLAGRRPENFCFVFDRAERRRRFGKVEA